MKINTESLFMDNCTMKVQCLLHKEYRKPTNTYMYLNMMLHYHLANKVCGYVFTHRAEVICNNSPCWNLPTRTVQEHSWQWPQHQTSCCQVTSAKIQTITRQLTMAAIFSIIQNTLSKISKAISKHYIKRVCTAPRKSCGCVHSMTLKTPRCGKMYVGQTCQSIRTRVTEHHHHIWLYQLKKSAVMEHKTDLSI